MFLLRLAFWLTLVLLILPMPDRGEDTPEAAAVSAPQVSVFDALGVAQSAISDVAGFCTRNPQTCETGLDLAGTLREKAQYSAQLVYEYLSNEKLEEAPGATGIAQPVVPVSPAPAAASAAEMAAPLPPVQDTLSEEDRQISWRGSING